MSAESEGSAITLFSHRSRSARVRHLSQTDGESLPEFATAKGDPQSYTERLNAFVAEKGIVLEYSDQIAPARGMSSGGKITLPLSLDSAETFSVVVHEGAQELPHRGDRRTQTTHTVRETEAEAVAFVVSGAIGLDVNTASSDYIQLHFRQPGDTSGIAGLRSSNRLRDPQGTSCRKSRRATEMHRAVRVSGSPVIVAVALWSLTDSRRFRCAY